MNVTIAGDDDGDDGIDFSDSFGPNGWPAWTILMLMSFWGLAAVCEDFFVPALNVLCIKLNMPDDVAGATFMAAGASSPELFSAIISLFVTKSALGIGTIIGSEIFNHLCICAGSIMYSKTGTLVLDFRVLSREVSFYGLAIIALLYCESDTHKCTNGDIESGDCYKEWDDGVGNELRIYLQWYKPLILLCCYVLYVLVCANYLKLIDIFCPRPLEMDNEKDGEETVSSFHGVSPSFVEDELSRSTVHYEPVANFMEDESQFGDIKTLPLFDGNVQRRNSYDGATSTPRDDVDFRNDSSILPSFTPVRNTIDMGIDNAPMTDRALRYSTGSTANQSMDARHISQGKFREHELRKALDGPAIFSVRSQLLQGALGVSSVVAPNAHMMLAANLHAVEASTSSFSCYLWKHSRFYSRIRLSSRAWQLKWVTIDGRGFRSCRNRDDPSHNVRPFNIYNATDVAVLDALRMTFVVRIPTGDLTFQAPSQLILEQVLSHIKSCIQAYSKMPSGQREELYNEAVVAAHENDENVARDSAGNIDQNSLISRQVEEDEDEEEEIESLMEWPHGSYFSVFVHVCLLPLKFLLHHTIPDVRYVKSRDKYLSSIAMCFFWLITLSFIMTISVEALAQVLNISDAVAGLTISAAGTSFPNLVASMIVARQGLGNMAVSNAFGSNVFNVFMGLGIPWLAYCFFAPENAEINTKYHTYHGLEAEGVLIPTVVLLVVLIIFILLLAISGMKLYMWHAYMFFLSYLLFLVWAVGWECSVPANWPQTF